MPAAGVRVASRREASTLPLVEEVKIVSGKRRWVSLDQPNLQDQRSHWEVIGIYGKFDFKKL